MPLRSHVAFAAAVFSCAPALSAQESASSAATAGHQPSAATPSAGSPLFFPGIVPRVSLGVSVLLKDSLHLIRGKRVGLITNHTGRDENGRSSIDLIYHAPGVRLTALFAPEHGIRGAIAGGETIRSGVDSATGVPIYSLYGDTRAPTARMLQNVDVLLYDIQDVGARMYTYIWTMTLAAEAATKAGKRFVVLDRPNPIRDDVIEGGFIEPRYRSFTGLHNVTLRYGLTIGELALYLAGTKQIAADVTVIPMTAYRASMWWDATGLEWVNPSPNIRGVEAALLYPGMSFLEATNVSEGRGTDSPFKLVGAPWLTDAGLIARTLNGMRIPGVSFDSTSRTIARGEKYGGQTIPMIRITITSRNAVRSADIGSQLLRQIYVRHPRQFRWRDVGIEELSGSTSLRRAVERGGIEGVLAQWRRESERFRMAVVPYRLYGR